MQRAELVGVQYLRGICALGVVVDHASGMAALPKYFGNELFNGVLVYGSVGVDIFFVISGFIITIVTLGQADLAPKQSRPLFFKKRFARIIPLMWVAILSYALLRWVFTATDTPIQGYINAFFLIPVGDVEPNPIWTLRHEAAFYIVFALSFLGRRELRFLLLLWFVSPILVFGYGLLSGEAVAPQSAVAIIFSPFNLEFGAGFLVGIVRLRSNGGKEIILPVHPFLILFCFAMIIMAIGGFLHQMHASLISVCSSAVLGGAVVALSAQVRCPDDLLSKTGRFLGSASYAIYLFHSHALSALLIVMTKAVPQVSVVWVVIIASFGATIFGIIVHVILERPLVETVHRWLIHRPVALPVGVREEARNPVGNGH